jgi:hypothetical protein
MSTRKRLYVGVTSNLKHAKFWSIPSSVTADNYPEYIYTIGPFRSVGGANVCIALQGNPSIQTVAEFERYSKSRNK